MAPRRPIPRGSAALPQRCHLQGCRRPIKGGRLAPPLFCPRAAHLWYRSAPGRSPQQQTGLLGQRPNPASLGEAACSGLRLRRGPPSSPRASDAGMLCCCCGSWSVRRSVPSDGCKHVSMNRGTARRRLRRPLSDQVQHRKESPKQKDPCVLQEEACAKIEAEARGMNMASSSGMAC